MKLFKWIRLKLTAREGQVIEELRSEIQQLKADNKINKEKIIELKRKELDDEIKIEFYDENIEEKIIKNICEAKEELCIAMAWFTSGEVMAELIKLSIKGVKVKVIVDENQYNRSEKTVYKIIDICTELSFAAVYSNEDKPKKKTMHNKYCIIDNKKVIDGSYNWTNNAQYNEEHIVIFHSIKVAKLFNGNFQKLYERYGEKDVENIIDEKH